MNLNIANAYIFMAIKAPYPLHALSYHYLHSLFIMRIVLSLGLFYKIPAVNTLPHYFEPLFQMASAQRLQTLVMGKV